MHPLRAHPAPYGTGAKPHTMQENHTITQWPAEQLRRIVEADDLHVAPLRADAKTLGTPTWIWCVASAGSLYVRAYNGPDSRGYQAALRQGAGRITAAGSTMDVVFNPGSHMNGAVDAAYRSKCHGHRYLGAMVSTPASAATLRVRPAR
jgi:hypothetical protein